MWCHWKKTWLLMLFFCLGLCKRWLEGRGQRVPRGQQVRRDLLCPGAGGHSCDGGLYSLLLRQLLQVMFLIYMTGGEGSNVGESWLTGQKPKSAGKRRRAVEETAEGSCCAGRVAGARGAGFSISPHASPCLRPVALHLAHLVFLFWSTEKHWLHWIHRDLFYL